jgi:hypothetical protein
VAWIWISIQKRGRIKRTKTSDFRKAGVYSEGLEVFQWMFNFSRYPGFLHKFCMKNTESGTEGKKLDSDPEKIHEDL